MPARLTRAAAIVSATLLAGQAHALSVTSEIDANALAGALFLNIPGLTVTNAVLSGGFFDPEGPGEGGQDVVPSIVADGPSQSGTFTNATGTYGLPSTGIVFSTGNVTDYNDAPTTDFETSTGFGMTATPEQNDLLDDITGTSFHYDPVQLDITFDAGPGVTSISFFAAFGSEEWPEFVGQFNDGFGLFLNGVNVAGAQESGAVPGDPILPINIDHPDMRRVPGTELNGVLAPNGIPVLRFDIPVDEDSADNTFTMILADANDDQLDTTIYLSSFIPTDTGPSTGTTEFNPLLPANPPDPATGTFIIEVTEIVEGQTVWIDPPVAIGYVYEVTNGAFDTVTAPSLATVPDADGYAVTVGGSTILLAAGASLDFFTAFGLNPTEFTLTGIDPALMLDPINPLAFPIGVSLTDMIPGTLPTFSITPITSEIPLPGGVALYLSALAFGAYRLRRRAA